MSQNYKENKGDALYKNDMKVNLKMLAIDMFHTSIEGGIVISLSLKNQEALFFFDVREK